MAVLVYAFGLRQPTGRAYTLDTMWRGNDYYNKMVAFDRMLKRIEYDAYYRKNQDPRLATYLKLGQEVSRLYDVKQGESDPLKAAKELARNAEKKRVSGIFAEKFAAAKPKDPDELMALYPSAVLGLEGDAALRAAKGAAKRAEVAIKAARKKEIDKIDADFGAWVVKNTAERDAKYDRDVATRKAITAGNKQRGVALAQAKAALKALGLPKAEARARRAELDAAEDTAKAKSKAAMVATYADAEARALRLDAAKATWEKHANELLAHTHAWQGDPQETPDEDLWPLALELKNISVAFKGLRASQPSITEEEFKEKLKALLAKQGQAQKDWNDFRTKVVKPLVRGFDFRVAGTHTWNVFMRRLTGETDLFSCTRDLAKDAIKKASADSRKAWGFPSFRKWPENFAVAKGLSVPAADIYGAVKDIRVEFTHRQDYTAATGKEPWWEGPTHPYTWTKDRDPDWGISKKRMKHCTLHMRISKSKVDGEHTYATWPMIQHRAFPEGTVIKRCKVFARVQWNPSGKRGWEAMLREKPPIPPGLGKQGKRAFQKKHAQGCHIRWEAQFTLNIPQTAPTVSSKSVEILFTPKRNPDGSLCLARWKDSDGKTGMITSRGLSKKVHTHTRGGFEVENPQAHDVDALFCKAEHIQGFRKMHMNSLAAAIRPMVQALDLSAYAPNPNDDPKAKEDRAWKLRSFQRARRCVWDKSEQVYNFWEVHGAILPPGVLEHLGLWRDGVRGLNTSIIQGYAQHGIELPSLEDLKLHYANGDRHLLQYEAGVRQAALNYRKDIMRKAAHMFATTYGAIRVDDTNYAEKKRRKPTKGKTAGENKIEAASQSIATKCAPGHFRELVQAAATARGVTFSKVEAKLLLA